MNANVHYEVVKFSFNNVCITSGVIEGNIRSSFYLKIQFS